MIRIPTLNALGALLVLVCTVGASAPGARSGSDVFEFAVIEDNDHSTLSIGDLDHRGGIGRLQDEVRATGKPLFWFSKGGREYVVRDPQLVARARTIVQPMVELGKKQGKIGARQGQIGALQGRAGMLEARLALSGLSADAEGRKERDAMRAELRELSAQIADLARDQRSLGDNQQELGAQQAELGRQQKTATRDAIAGLRELAEEAIASGAAERVHG